MISLWIEIVAGHPRQSDRCQITGRAQRYRKIIGNHRKIWFFRWFSDNSEPVHTYPIPGGCLATISIHRDIIYITRFKTVFSTDEYFTMKKLENYLSHSAENNVFSDGFPTDSDDTLRNTVEIQSSHFEKACGGLWNRLLNLRCPVTHRWTHMTS